MNKNWCGLIKAVKWLVFSASCSALIAGCGSSSSVTPPPAAVVISGTAAAGAPVVGYVSVSDSSTSTQPVKSGIPIMGNGQYTVDVTGLKAPYAFHAEGTVGGQRVSLYSAATADDQGKTINITPFTDLIIRNIAGGVVETYLQNNSNMANLTTAALNEKRQALTAILAPALAAMGVDSSIDLLRTAFNADNSGLDRFMDAVKVDATTPGAVTITNILDAANKLTLDTTVALPATPTATLTVANLSPTATPLDLIVAGFNTMTSAFANGLPSPSDPNLLALFNSNFMQDGNNLATFLSNVTASSDFAGMKFANVNIESINTTTGLAKVHFTPMKADGTLLNSGSPGGVMTWQFTNAGGGASWLANGNRRVAWVKVTPFAMKGVCKLGSTSGCISANGAATSYRTGLRFAIEPNGLVNGTTAIASAVVTGPGLPANGVTLTAQTTSNWLKVTTTQSACTAQGQWGCNLQYWLMDDTAIGLISANSQYTVTLYDAVTPTPNVLATYTETIAAAPKLNTELAAISYPVISGEENPAGIATAHTFTPSWSLPTGLQGGAFWMFASDVNNNFQNAGKDIFTATGTQSLSLTAPATPFTSGGYDLYSFDLYARRVETQHAYW